eukprot:10192613-Alexandrium_andersonii.AAC.1
MSASLVGSEMCIRDSGCNCSRPSTSLGFCAWPLRPRSCSNGRRGWHPVSYTHLTLPTICSV